MFDRHQGEFSPWISRIWRRNEREAMRTGETSSSASGDSRLEIGTAVIVLEPAAARS
jgi:hypothetical protein